MQRNPDFIGFEFISCVIGILLILNIVNNVDVETGEMMKFFVSLKNEMCCDDYNPVEV